MSDSMVMDRPRASKGRRAARTLEVTAAAPEVAKPAKGQPARMDDAPKSKFAAFSKIGSVASPVVGQVQRRIPFHRLDTPVMGVASGIAVCVFGASILF